MINLTTLKKLIRGPYYQILPSLALGQLIEISAMPEKCESLGSVLEEIHKTPLKPCVIPYTIVRQITFALHKQPKEYSHT